MEQRGRLMFVHAHPDDETIGTGVTMARYVRDGHGVTVVTCTLGEEGEVLVPELEHLDVHHDDALGAHRGGELADAMAILGVTDSVRLGGDGRFRDSGMIGMASNERDDCFWRADLLTAAAEMAALIRDRRPHVLVTYDDFGGYGHPDHIQAHRVAMYGAQLAGAPSFRPELGQPWAVDKIYWTAFPRSSVDRARALMAQRGEDFFASDEPEDGTPWACPDEWITTSIEAFELEPLKVQALLAHRTQITPETPFLAISKAVGPAGLGTEHYRLVHGTAPSSGPETDLLVGIDLTR